VTVVRRAGTHRLELALVVAVALPACGAADEAPAANQPTTPAANGAPTSAIDTTTTESTEASETTESTLTTTLEDDVVYDGSMATNALHVTGPDDASVERAVTTLGGRVVDRVDVAGSVVYVAVFYVAHVDELAEVRSALTDERAITAEFIPQFTTG
jgi:hypothetical protein